MISKISEIFNNHDIQNNSYNIQNSLNTFKLPITYIDNKYLLQESIKTDLELIENNISTTLYDYVFNPGTDYAKKIIPMWSEYYTTNIPFLNDTKTLIKNFKPTVQIEEVINIGKVDEILFSINSKSVFIDSCKRYLLSIYVMGNLKVFRLF